MQHISKHRIVPGFNQRERIATEWVYAYYQTPLYVYIRKLTGNCQETDDLVAKTFLALLEHKRPFDSLRKMEHFLYTAAKNICVTHLRHRKTVKDKSGDVANHYLSIEEETVKAAEQSAAFHHLIQLGIEILPLRCKEVFMLCYIGHMKNAEIASKLKVREKTVANLKIRAYDKLKKEIRATKHAWLMDLLGILLL